MERVHHARHITQQGKHEIEPKLASQTDSIKHTERRQYSGTDHLHGTRNHGSHGALLSEGRWRTSRLVPRQSAGFPLASNANSIPQRPAAPGTAPMEKIESRSTYPMPKLWLTAKRASRTAKLD